MRFISAQEENAADVLRRLSKIPCEDELTRRDFYDIARTVISRMINGAIIKAELLFTQGASTDELERVMTKAEKLLEVLTELLGTHEDYSLLATLRRMQSVTETNPNFEQTLKNNAECGYCRAYIYENAEYLYLPEMKMLFDGVKRAGAVGADIDKNAFAKRAEEIRRIYFETPLAEMKRAEGSYSEIVLRAAELIEEN